MKKDNSTKITRYNFDRHGFYFEIVETRDEFDAWIGLGRYGIKSFCFGQSKASTSREGFLDLLEGNAVEEIAMFLMEYDEIDDPEILEDYEIALEFVRARAQFCEDKAAIARDCVAKGLKLDETRGEYGDRLKALKQLYADETGYWF